MLLSMDRTILSCWAYEGAPSVTMRQAMLSPLCFVGGGVEICAAPGRYWTNANTNAKPAGAP